MQTQTLSIDKSTSPPVVETLRHKRFSLVNVWVLTVLPVMSLAAVIWYVANYGFHWGDLAVFGIMYYLTGLSITGGYHRHFSHRAYDCHPIVQAFYLLFGAAALQNSALVWCSDHRYHHRHVDKNEDPYNINKGFFFAHMGWMFYTDDSNRPYSNVQDLKKNPLFMIQHRYYLPIVLLVGLGVPYLMGLTYGNPWGAVIWGGLFRLTFLHHCTFLINSAAHVFGKRPFSTQNTARDSWWLAFFSFGEGYHNFHHAFPSDYRNGIAWYDWDPTKWLIRGLSAVKLGWGLKQTSAETIEKAKERCRLEQERGLKSVSGLDVAGAVPSSVAYSSKNMPSRA